MKFFTIILVSAGAVAGAASSPVTLSASQPETLWRSVAVQQFQLNVGRYMAVKREATATVAAPRVTRNAQTLLAQRSALAMAIRTLRPGARPGDIFVADVRSAFRLLVERAMTAHGDTTARMMARAAEDMVEPCDIRPAVNESFPWQLSEMVPPYLLSVLPALPPGLQYRIVERDLILLDLDANLVVDILKDALPPVDVTSGIGIPHARSSGAARQSRVETAAWWRRLR